MRSLVLPSSISATARIRIDRAAHDDAAGGEVGRLHEVHQVVDGGFRVIDEVDHRVDDLAEVVRWDVRGHADRDALAAVDEQVRETRREHRGLLVAAVVVGDLVDGVLVDAGEHLHRERRQPALGVTLGRGRIVGGTEVAVAVDERVAQRERLRHARQRVVDRLVAVGVVVAHHVTGDAGGLHVRAVRTSVELVHAPQDAAMHGLEAVARVGERPADDDRHGVLEERALHLLLDLDGLDAAAGGDDRREVDRWLVARTTVARAWRRGFDVAHLTLLICRGTSRPWRWSG
jgi:hypothetical protein